MRAVARADAFNEMKKLLFLLIGLVVLMCASPAVAAPRDRDHDGLPDRWERKHQLSTKHNSANGDADRDGIDNRNELVEGTNPRVKDSNRNRTRDAAEDTDGDGLSNGAEDRFGQDPTDPDTDDDGIIDSKENAGVVKSVGGGRLVIALLSGGTIEGRISDDLTDIGCGTESDAEAIQNRSLGDEPDDPTADELDSEDVSDADANAEDGNDGDTGSYDMADADSSGDDADDGDTTDSEYQDDLHDFEDVCEVSDFRRGARIREATLVDGSFDEVELMLAR